MIEKPEKPEKKYKTVIELYRELTYNCKKEVLWACHRCNGIGKINKCRIGYANYIPCPICRGSGALNREYYAEKFKEYLTSYENALQSYREDQRFYESIRSRLTKEEWEWLNRA